MTSYLWRFAIHLLSVQGFTSASLLTKTATAGKDLHFTCNFAKGAVGIVSIVRDHTDECIIDVARTCGLLYCNANYDYFCNGSTIILTIPGKFDIDSLHGSRWKCHNKLANVYSNVLLLYVNVPITNISLTATPYDKSPVEILAGSSQHFTCTANPGRPPSKIQWYLSGANITNAATAQPDACHPGCNEKVMSSSVLLYIGNINDNGKTIYCTAENVDEQSVRSMDRRIDILYPPVIFNIPDNTITEGSILHITPTIDANPHPISVWWTRQNDTSYMYTGMNLTINNIQRESSDYYICHAMNTITTSSHSTQNRTTEKLFKVNVLYEPVIDGIQDYNIEAGRTLTVTPTIDANPAPTAIWWTRQNDISFIYHGLNLKITNIHKRDSNNYTCHVMNTLTPSGLSAQNRTSITVFNINVQKISNEESVNGAAVGVGTGFAVILLILGVTILIIFLYRKRRIIERKENSNSRVYESRLDKPRVFNFRLYCS